MEPGRVGDSFGGYRTRLVEHLRRQGIRDLAVLQAVSEVPRHVFVPEALRRRAYDDTALPIGYGQTISQPSTQARYLEALELTGTERVLEIGTGSGYQAALLAHLTDRVITIERIRALADLARRGFQQAGLDNVLLIVGDGSLGWRSEAPYDAIVVAAAGPTVPRPLIEQLREGGRLVMPLAEGTTQHLTRVTKRGSGVETETLGEDRFVPLRGRHGFSADEAAAGDA
ncbi:MAG: protein-L-isoaspartate(D-aspartate) O-methyltransferase [Gemmatimonadota bacterium]|nr:protein-L-isoaspartate(D-aspartate) O-methyltransferase [Gemmatimonadota bacterium]